MSKFPNLSEPKRIIEYQGFFEKILASALVIQGKSARRFAGCISIYDRQQNILASLPIGQDFISQEELEKHCQTATNSLLHLLQTGEHRYSGSVQLQHFLVSYSGFSTSGMNEAVSLVFAMYLQEMHFDVTNSFLSVDFRKAAKAKANSWKVSYSPNNGLITELAEIAFF